MEASPSSTSTTVLCFTAQEVSPSSQEIAIRAGGSRYALDSRHRGLVEEVQQQALSLAEPRVAYALHEVATASAQEGVFLLANGMRVQAPALLVDAQARFLAAVVATIEAELERACRQMHREGDHLRALFLDAAGVAMLELLECCTLETLGHVAKEMNLHTGQRLAPGCLGLDMSSQEVLFRLVDGQAIGVALGMSWVMTPLKSHSFFLPITGDAARARRVHKCRSCPLKDCPYRTWEDHGYPDPDQL